VVKTSKIDYTNLEKIKIRNLKSIEDKRWTNNKKSVKYCLNRVLRNTGWGA